MLHWICAVSRSNLKSPSLRGRQAFSQLTFSPSKHLRQCIAPQSHPGGRSLALWDCYLRGAFSASSVVSQAAARGSANRALDAGSGSLAITGINHWSGRPALTRCSAVGSLWVIACTFPDQIRRPNEACPHRSSPTDLGAVHVRTSQHRLSQALHIDKRLSC